MKTKLFKSKDELLEVLMDTVNNYNLSSDNDYLFRLNMDNLSYQIKGAYYFAICNETVSVITSSKKTLYHLYDKKTIKSVFIASFGEVYKLKEIVVSK